MMSTASRVPHRATHEVVNQPPPLVDYNAFDSDIALASSVEREGGLWGLDRVRDFGAVVASSQVPAQRFYRLMTPARAPQIIRSRRAVLARPYKARHPIRKRTAGHRDRCETFFSLRTSKPHTKPLLRRRKK